jgi:hypothetical protein
MFGDGKEQAGTEGFFRAIKVGAACLKQQKALGS